MKKFLATFALSLILLCITLPALSGVVFADDPPAGSGGPANTASNPTANPGTTPPTTAGAGQGVPIDTSTLPSNVPLLNTNGAKDPIAATESFMLRYIIRPIFFVSGGVAVLVIMYSGFQIISAQGEEEGITNAKTTLTWAFVGLGLVVLAYTIVSNLANILQGAGLI